MKKKLMSLLLTGALATSMVGAAAVSASAAVDAEGRYYPTTDETYRYYFYMPADWENELSTEASIYWWGGTDACGALDGSGNTTQWPGYKAQKGDFENVFYVDCPIDVTTIIWSNGIDGGTDKTTQAYKLSKQTNNIGSEYYDEDESDLYPEGTENFDEMIYVIDPNLTSMTETSEKLAYMGEWYYYYGNGEYGTYPDKADAVAADAVYNTDYYPPKDPNATPDEAPSNPSGDDNTGNQDGNTNKPGQPSPDATSGTNPAGSATSDSAKGGSSNGAVQTGAASMAVVLLAVLSSVTGIVVLTRKKFD